MVICFGINKFRSTFCTYVFIYIFHPNFITVGYQPIIYMPEEKLADLWDNTKGHNPGDLDTGLGQYYLGGITMRQRHT